MSLVGRLLLVLLLLLQAWIGITRGDAVCIALAPCTAHAAGSAAEPGPTSPCSDHSHGPAPVGSHEHPDCPCHVHVDGIDVTLAPFSGSSGVRTVAETQPAPLEKPWIETHAVAADGRDAPLVRASLAAPPPLPPPARIRPSRLVV